MHPHKTEGWSAIAAEYLGIPAVVIAGPGFSDQARHTALNNGIPALRITGGRCRPLKEFYLK